MIDKIVIHCSASPHDRGDDAATIHRWHLSRGWDGIGYHYVILEDGTVQNGRPEYWAGAHTRGHNKNSLGICLMGDETFTDEQNGALVELLRTLMERYPEPWIVGHYMLDPHKTCPNFDVPEWLASHGFA